MLASTAVESPLTGLGAGGFMLVHRPGAEPVLLDFFVAAPGLGGTERRAELVPVEVDFGDTTQVFNVGAASCGVPGVPSGLAAACGRFGTMPLSELVRPAVRLAREGVELTPQQGYLFEILAGVLAREPAGAAVYAPGGRILGTGERFAFPALAETLERFGAEGPEPFYRGEIASAIAAGVQAAGGTIDLADLAAYETVERRPVRARFGPAEILTNPPPSSGGILIALALDLLDRLGTVDVETLVTVMEQAQLARTRAFHDGLYEDGFSERFLAAEALEAAAERTRGPRPVPPSPDDRLGSTTHITAFDGAGGCASVTCSNGTGSGFFVADTGIQLNNMLGESDLNPFGFHATPPGRRMPSMMSPTVALRGGELALGLGSGGSNRIRSAITQVLVRRLADGLDAERAVIAPRVHFEDGVVHAEPGVDEAALARLEKRGYRVVRWRSRNLFFGGVHTVVAGPDGPDAAGDPRRGGATA